MTLRLMLGGLKSFLPDLSLGHRGADGTTSGAYYYAVWMRHRAIIARTLPEFQPRMVVEIGPKDSLGLGCAALLSGAERYVGLDVVERARPEYDLQVLDELVPLFERRTPIPNDTAFPSLQPRLSSYAFPRKLFADDGARALRLSGDRIEKIRSALVSRHPVLYDDVPVGYLAPWNERSIDRDSADLVITQAALQNIPHDDRDSRLARAFAAMAKWLRPGGVMSHQIDFAYPGGECWNHHWRYSDAAWRVVRGHRRLFENRASLSAYLALCEENGCEVRSVKRVEQEGLPRDRMAPRFRELPEQDYRTSSAYILAVKR